MARKLVDELQKVYNSHNFIYYTTDKKENLYCNNGRRIFTFIILCLLLQYIISFATTPKSGQPGSGQPSEHRSAVQGRGFHGHPRAATTATSACKHKRQEHDTAHPGHLSQCRKPSQLAAATVAATSFPSRL